MLTGSPVIVVPLLRLCVGMWCALRVLQFCWQDSVPVLDEACMASMRTLDRSIGHVCRSIFAAASKQLPYSGGNGPPLLCATAVDFWSAVVRRRMTAFERCFLSTGNPLGHREHWRRLETGLQHPEWHV